MEKHIVKLSREPHTVSLADRACSLFLDPESGSIFLDEGEGEGRVNGAVFSASRFPRFSVQSAATPTCRLELQYCETSWIIGETPDREALQQWAESANSILAAKSNPNADSIPPVSPIHSIKMNNEGFVRDEQGRITNSCSAQEADGAFVALTDVRKRYGERAVLDGVSLSVRSGETVALLGPSGGGKSTLLRCLNGLCCFDAGTVQVGPHIISADESRRSGPAVLLARSLLGMIFQDFQLFPHLTALGNVMEAPVRVLKRRRRDVREQALALLERVGLSGHAGHYPQQLSGGQKQRVAIARALAMEPRGLLCDEITSALDPELKGEVLDVLAGLKRDGLTLLLVTHEIGFARRAADRVIVLADGRIVEEGTPDDVLNRPRTERTQQFLSRVFV